MDIFRIYVTVDEYFPSVQEVINFSFEFWENKIFQSKVDAENILSFLRPEGMIAMRLANPLLALSFDRAPRKTPDDSIVSQSSAEKFKQYDFRKLCELLVKR